MIDSIVNEYRMTRVHFTILGKVAARYGIMEALIYDLNSTDNEAYRKDLKQYLHEERER